MGIRENVEKILSSIPTNVILIAASKTRIIEEIEEAYDAGIVNMGENYIKEAIPKIENSESMKIRWHFIGHLQKNKVKKAVKYFDVIQTVDSLELATLIDKESEKLNKTIDIMVEINIAEEEQKSGVLPNKTLELCNKIKDLKNINLVGIMTMGPVVSDIEEIRPFFKKAKEIYDKVRAQISTVKYLSMGMSDSYKIAIEEGSNVIRIGTKIFGPREYNKVQ
jgi:pyridoxal phosphate enzyme (YggS family)